MRPTAKRQSHVRCPLNLILGTEARIRLLRVLYLTDIPVGVSELARQTSLQVGGVAKVCADLEDLGAIEVVGRGSHGRQYRRRPGFRLANQLQALFAEERAAIERMLEELRQAARGFGSTLRSCWIAGSFAAGTDTPADAIEVGAIVAPTDADDVKQALWTRLLDLQQRYDVVMELRVDTMADVLAAGADRLAALEHGILISGTPPGDLVAAATGGEGRTPSVTTHGGLDERMKLLAGAIADRIRINPAIIEDTRHSITRRLPGASASERLALEEWQEVLEGMSTPRLRRFLLEDSARARRLRQSLPFHGVLTDEERRAVLGSSRQAGDA